MAYPQQSPSNSSTNYLPDGTSQSAGFSATTQYLPSSDPSTNRLGTLSEGLAKGGALALDAIKGSVFNFLFNPSSSNTNIEPNDDWRVRVSMQPATAALFYNNPNNPILSSLSETNGVIFPYTPQIDVSYNANYMDQGLTHSNYNSYYYNRSEVQAIMINADFTVQNIKEGQYLAAAMHFFKSCTKMFYGNSQLAGTPPPMVFLDGYGPAVLPHVPCLVTSFSYVMPGDVDYVKVPIGVKLQDTTGNPIQSNKFSTVARLPTACTLRVSLQPVYSKNNIARNFTLENYSSGYLIQDSYSDRGGFI